MKDMNRQPPLLILLFFLATALSCSKEHIDELNEIPASVQQQMNGKTCSQCPYYIQIVHLSDDTYYMIGPKPSAPGIICDWFVPYLFYNSNGEKVDAQSDLYSDLIAHSVKGEIIFDCP
jgi:hypothetical protein